MANGSQNGGPLTDVSDVALASEFCEHTSHYPSHQQPHQQTLQQQQQYQRQLSFMWDTTTATACIPTHIDKKFATANTTAAAAAAATLTKTSDATLTKSTRTKSSSIEMRDLTALKKELRTKAKNAKQQQVLEQPQQQQQATTQQNQKRHIHFQVVGCAQIWIAKATTRICKKNIVELAAVKSEETNLKTENAGNKF